MSVIPAGRTLNYIWYQPVTLPLGLTDVASSDVTFEASTVSATTCVQSFSNQSDLSLGAGFASGVLQYQPEGGTPIGDTPGPNTGVGFPALYEDNVVQITFGYEMFPPPENIPQLYVNFMGYVYFWNTPLWHETGIPPGLTNNLPSSTQRGSGAPAPRGGGKGGQVRERVGLLYDRNGRIMHVHRVTDIGGGKMPADAELEKRTFELAKIMGSAAPKLRFLSASPEQFDFRTHYEVGPKGRLAKVQTKKKSAQERASYAPSQGRPR